MKKLYLMMMLSIVLCFTAIAQNLTTSKLPIIVINTNGGVIGDEPKIKADMGIIDNGPGQVNNIADAFNDYNGKIGIEFRGSSSQDMFPKKPYGIELQDDAGFGISAPLLGMPAEEDWTLNATYNDKSLMRDVLAYKLARDVGRYAPRTRYCELMINGEYQGLYVLIEKIKRDKNRVDISKLEPSENEGDDVTGGYILKIDKTTGTSGPGFYSSFAPPNRVADQSIFFQYDYPKFDQITLEQKAYIKKYIRDFETVLNSSSFADPVNGYQKYIDMNSFIDFLIVNEVSKNIDGYRLSSYLYKDKSSNGGKLVMGPVWDFNLAFGNANYCDGGTTGRWMYDFNSICGDDSWLVPFWWKKFLYDRNFTNALAARWIELRQDKFSSAKVSDYIDSVANVLAQGSMQRNFQKWPVLGTPLWPNYYVGNTFSEEVNWLKGWYDDRATWLDLNMPSVVTGTEAPLHSALSVKSYPNPFDSNLAFEIEIEQAGIVTVILNDVLGKEIVYEERSYGRKGNYKIQLTPLNLPDGAYFATIRFNSSVVKKMKLFRQP
jgi:hypothetical protein